MHKIDLLVGPADWNDGTKGISLFIRFGTKVIFCPFEDEVILDSSIHTHMDTYTKTDVWLASSFPLIA